MELGDRYGSSPSRPDGRILLKGSKRVAKVKLEVISWLGRALDAGDSGLVQVEFEVAEGSTVKALFDRLAGEYRYFGEYIFDQEAQNLTGRVSVFFNERVLELVKGLETEIADGDAILIVPAYSGG